ncbi:MAG: GSU2403 family nucleotidyltransferase fold protein, partial [Betaproteobacteria bacterium]
AGRLLRALDQVESIGKQILVIGTHAVTAYEVAARNRFAVGLEATEDLDFTLLVGTPERPIDPDVPRRLLLTLRQVDRSFIVSNSPKTIVNRSGYRVDLLMSKDVVQVMDSALPWKPQMLPGQEWLLLGQPLEQVVVDFSGWPVPIVAPDPRYFALHKLWLSEQRDRIRSGKSQKDRQQGQVLVEAIRMHMPHYPLDEDFRHGIPEPLKRHLS